MPEGGFQLDALAGVQGGNPGMDNPGRRQQRRKRPDPPANPEFAAEHRQHAEGTPRRGQDCFSDPRCGKAQCEGAGRPETRGARREARQLHL